MGAIKEFAKMGFGLGLGFLGAQLIFVALGLAFFVPGLILVRSAKREGDTNSGSYYGGITLLAIGVIFMGGAGLGTLIDNL